MVNSCMISYELFRKNIKLISNADLCLNKTAQFLSQPIFLLIKYNSTLTIFKLAIKIQDKYDRVFKSLFKGYT
jgi:hypothetical protein